MWQWWNCLEEQVALPRKVLRVNVDETAVRFYMPQRKSHTQCLCKQLTANFYACSLELCTSTYQKGKPRVHCHCYFKKDQKKIRATVHDIFRFRGSQAHLKADDS